MVDYKNNFFREVKERLKDRCNYDIYRDDKPTYIAFKAATGTEVSVVVTTKFNPKNTVRIQMPSIYCIKEPQSHILTESEREAVEKHLGVMLTDESGKPKPAESAHNDSEYKYYRLMFPFNNDPMDVVDNVANTLVEIFNTIEEMSRS